MTQSIEQQLVDRGIERDIQLTLREIDYFMQQLVEYGSEGPYYVQYWSRDCDMCESTSHYTVETLEKLMDRYIGYVAGLEDQEGPSSWTLLSDYVYCGDQRHVRDRVMEAYENGGNCYAV